MSVSQVQLRLSIDGQQALSTLDAVELKQQNLISSNKALSDARNEADKEWTKNLAKAYKLQEKQQLLEKQMAVASESGQFVQLTKMEAQYEANADKITLLLNANIKLDEFVRESDITIAENNKLIKANRNEIETLIKSEGDLLRQDAKLLAEKKAMNREISIASNGSERQQKAQNRLAEIEKELATRSRERAKATADGIQKIIKEQGFEKVSTQQLIDLNKYLENANKHRVDRASADAKDEIQSIKDVNKELANRKEETAPDSGGFLKNFKGNLSSAVVGGAAGAMAGGLFTLATEAVAKLGEAVSATIDRIAKKAKEITAIQTSLDVTRLKAREINQDLSKIDTTTSVAELNKLVEVSGDLNIATSEIKDFVTQADQIGVVMEKDFGSAEQAVTMITKLKDEFRETKELKADIALQKIGSSLKDINLAGPATTQGVTDFLKRTGALPDALKPAITELIGFAAVFEEANLTAEISSSGFAKIITESANNIGAVAKQLKISKQEVENLINTNPSEFVLKLASSLKGLSGTQVSQTLKNLKLDSDEVKKVMGILSDNIEKVREKQDLANKSFQEASTIQRIFTDINNDEAAKIDKISKSWDSLKNSMSSWVALLVGPVINSLAGITSKSKDLTLAYRNQENQTKSLISTVTPLREQYEKLKDDAKKGADNHRELNKVIGEIGKVVPEAITQQDNYGNALSINIGLLDEYIKKQKQAQEQMKYRLKEEYTGKNNALAGERAALVQKMREKEVVTNIDKRTGDVTTRTITHTERLQDQKRIDEINKEIQDNWNSKRNLDKEQAVTPPKTDKPDLKGGKKELTDDEKSKAKAKRDKAEQLRIAEEKYIQERNKQRIELEAKLAFEERLAIANEEQKKILQIEHKAEQELQQVRTQFKDKNNLVIEFSKLSKEEQELIGRDEALIQKRVAEEKLKIQQDYFKKQDDAYEQHATRAIQISQEQNKLDLDRNLQRVKNGGNPLAIFNAEERIINNDQAGENYNENIKYLKEQETAKDNVKALELIEENHKKTLELIQAKYQAKRDQHIADANEKEKVNAERNKINSLELDIRETEAKGKNPLEQKLTLLKVQENAEIESAVKTGKIINDIHRDFALKRQALEAESWHTQAGKAIEHFQTAFNAVANIANTVLQNRTAQEQNHYDSTIRNLDSEKEHGIITSRQYNKQKLILDKEHDKEQRKLKREQFELDKAANIANIIMKTALAVMNTAATAGPWAIPATIALGAVELGIAASQVAPPYFDGGALPDNFQNPVDSKGGGLIIAHPGEYMIPKWIRETPTFANLEPVIEHMRATGRSYYDGGAIFNTPNPTAPMANNFSQMDVSKFMAMMDTFGQHIDSFGQKLETPITAHTAIGEQEIFKLEQEKTKLNTKMNDSYTNSNQSLIQ